MSEGVRSHNNPCGGQLTFLRVAASSNTALNRLNQTTQQNASSSEELSATPEEMSAQAEQLQQLMGFFKVTGQGHRAPIKPKGPAKAKASKATTVEAEAASDEFVKF